MRTLAQWIPQSRKTTVCIDSYQDGIFQGRFYGPEGETQQFRSLSQFLVMMEAMLEQREEPQSDTIRRSFSAFLPQEGTAGCWNGIRRGEQATFELQILFRQHTSWQGRVLWKDQHWEQQFRSVLELILLMDSALRETEGREAG